MPDHCVTPVTPTTAAEEIKREQIQEASRYSENCDVLFLFRDYLGN